ncbi:TMEM43 family protein [Legionella fallonii]|uniref:Transmembrane protein n=1 Tax=Legionella fallonii LLAP-10 TaxID=1212491 RepID=A0A098G6M4_9GAMM|nr:TMEM43 family protein [Legionella fallonii]CEG58107.1 conserved membrane protein of unknown function [Legionella fallonii LLAP-10]
MTEEITTTSWFTRLKNALIGILVGIALIIGAIVLIFWNEGHSLHTAQSLEQTRKAVTPVAKAPINNQNNLKVVYLSGLATTNDKLVDPLLGITVTAINLDRKVEMYQWQEHSETKTEKQIGGSEKQTKTYTYNKVWSNHLIDSSTFHDQAGHQNPTSMSIQSQLQYATKVTLGDFILPGELIRQINVSQPVNLAQVNQESLKSQSNKPVQLSNSELYLGQNSQTPETGDLRIAVTAAYPQDVSIIAQQTGNTLQPYHAPAGEDIMLLSTGQHSSDQMIDDAKAQNKLMTWVLRAVALAMLIIGFSLIMNPLVVLADVLPFLGSIVGFGTGLISFLCGASVWLIATAIAWFTIRPFVSIGLLLIMVIGWFTLVKTRKASIPPEPATQGASLRKG